MIARKGRARTMEFGVKFNDKAQSIVTVIRGIYEGKATWEHSIERIDDQKEYFKRRLKGK